MYPQQTTQSQQPSVPPQFPPSPTPTQIPLPPKPKLPLILLITIIVVLLLGGGYYFLSGKSKLITQPTIIPTKAIMQTPISSPASNLTIDWKTYTNNQYFYSVKYPRDWLIFEEDKQKLVKIANFDTNKPIDNETNKGIFSISVYIDNQNNLTPKEWLNNEIEGCKTGCAPSPPKFIRELIIDGKPAIETDNPLPGDLSTKSTSYFVGYKNKIYELKLQYGFQEEDKLTSIFSQIFSTFTFLDQNQPIPTTQSLDTSNWKTYINSEYKFTLKYPPEWTGTEVNTEEVRFFKNLYLNSQSDTKTYISVTVKTNPNNQNLKEWLIAQNLISANYSEDFHTQIDETTIANIKGLKITTPVNGGQETYYLPMNRNVIQITYIFKGQNLAEYNELVSIFNQILSTFKFINY